MDSSGILDIIKHSDLSRIYFSKKDAIEICQHCEFRHMCVDDRMPLKITDKLWKHKSECQYNPFSCKWKGDKGYLNLHESGVEILNGELMINQDKLKGVISQLWE